jgi:polyisoprenoid-binding protein YceI
MVIVMVVEYRFFAHFEHWRNCMNLKKHYVGVLFSALWLTVNASSFTQIETKQSRIVFAYEQMGVASEGEFKNFSATMNFNPTALSNSQLHFVIDVNSIETGVPGGDDEVKGKAWLNAQRFPQAIFVAKQFTRSSPDQFTTNGSLTIKGVSQTLNVPFKLVGNRAEGQIKFKRSTFKIGEGEWADTSVVADDVVVKFVLTLK